MAEILQEMPKDPAKCLFAALQKRLLQVSSWQLFLLTFCRKAKNCLLFPQLLWQLQRFENKCLGQAEKKVEKLLSALSTQFLFSIVDFNVEDELFEFDETSEAPETPTR